MLKTNRPGVSTGRQLRGSEKRGRVGRKVLIQTLFRFVVQI